MLSRWATGIKTLLAVYKCDMGLKTEGTCLTCTSECGNMDVFTVADMCVECQRLPKDHFMFYLEDADEAGFKLCRHWAGIFQARDGDLQDRAFETTLRFVQRAQKDLQWTLNNEDFDAMLAAKGVSNSAGRASQLFAAYGQHLAGEQFSYELHGKQ